MSGGRYILVDRRPEPVSDGLAWARWFETADRSVARDEIGAGDDVVIVSTVFIGLDHNWSGEGPPLLFETMIFISGDDSLDADECERTSTWDEALQAHARMLARVLAARRPS